jgi:hypothetical protein
MANFTENNCLYGSWSKDNITLHTKSLYIHTLKPNNYLVHYTWEILSDLRKVGGFLRVLRFRHQYNWPTRYNWNIVESGVKYHNPNPSPLHVSAPKDQVIKWVYQWNYWNVLVSFKSDIISLSNLIVFRQFIARCLFFRVRHKWFSGDTFMKWNKIIKSINW